ncbi:MAG: diguanylate cyclase, partial [Nitriliruptor sp.]
SQGGVLPVTASVGIATATPDATDVEDLLRSADAAMYRTKREGGAGVSWSQDGSDGSAPPPSMATSSR